MRCKAASPTSLRQGAAALSPTEDAEQQVVVQWLELHRLHYTHVPNGGWRHVATARRLKALGVKAGVPDLLIFERPPARPDAVGVAIEMKRAKGGRVSAEQQRWLAHLERQGWVVAVCQGAGEAVELLRGLGFGRRARPA